MSDVSPIRGVVVGHADLSTGLLGAVRKIVGDAADVLEPLSNDGMSPQALIEELDRIAGDDAVVVFVDLRAGSCGMAAFSCCRERPMRAVVCGVNLPMLLDFVFQNRMPLEELVPRLVEKGRAAIGEPVGKA
jgi:mannose/fructose-specific phosphotransferase system component IIA